MASDSMLSAGLKGVDAWHMGQTPMQEERAQVATKQ